jgi:hypothetical protein
VVRKSAMPCDARTTPPELTGVCTSHSLQQTNTSDMLDLAVDYIKDLQQQVKVRSRHRITLTPPANDHSLSVA